MPRMRLRLCLLLLAVLFIATACGGTVTQKTEPIEQHGARTATVSITPTAATVSKPTRLVISTVGINALIESVGIQANGDLATPTQSPWENVGWYHLGTLPGQRGSAVIDGHLDRPGGSPAVFWRLRGIHVGDEVDVTNSANKSLHFRVTRIAYYTPAEAPLQDIFGNMSGSYLNLITCAGDWIPTQHQTTMRLVVYTTLM